LFSSLSSIVGLSLLGALCIATLAHAASAQAPDPEQLFREAFEAQQRGDAALAVRKYEELIRLHPEITAARANLGIVLVSLGRYDEAIAQYRAALKQVPDNPDLRLNLALAYYKKGDFVAAGDVFSSLHEAEPANVRIATLLGQCYVHLGRDAEVIALLEPLEQADNLDLEWALGSALIRSGRTQEGLQRVERVAQEGHSAEAYMLAAQAYLQMGLVTSARRNVDAAKKLNPNLPGLQTLDGIILDYSGDSKQAASAFQEAVRADPNDFQARLRLGAALYKARMLKAAREQLDAAVELDPNSSSARYELARVERAQGDLGAALKNLQIAERQEPGWIQPHIELVALYYLLKQPESSAEEKRIVQQLMAEKQKQGPVPGVTGLGAPSH
jgi:tetratricopeptide (TPR) repeat protein